MNSGSKDKDVDDLALWRRITETAEPLPDHHRSTGRQANAGKPPGRDKNPKKKTSRPAITLASQIHDAAHQSPPPATHAIFHKREKRRLSTGRSKIDARIDLHGMRQAEAHHTLQAFLHRARDRGLRTVLIITGKGDGGASLRYQPFGEERQERGILRRMISHWLAEPGLHDIVAGFESAHPRHGGEGALYVRLRRSRE